MCRYLFILFLVVPRLPSELILALVVIPITDRLSRYLSGGSKLKRLGDPPPIPSRLFETRDLETFIKLASVPRGTDQSLYILSTVSFVYTSQCIAWLIIYILSVL
jgi:hypothetical protein